MFFVLSKVLAFLFMPLTWVFILLLLGFWKRRRIWFLAALITLWFFSNAFIINEVNRWWEPQVTPRSHVPTTEYGVLLGGFSYYDSTSEVLTFQKTADRFLQAIHLYQGGAFRHLVISSGSGLLLQPEMKEAIYVGHYMDEIRLPMRRVSIESESKNTHENALFTLAVLKEAGWHGEPVMLITSAFHMRRAQRCFERVGIPVIPYPTDAVAGQRQWNPGHMLLPNAYALAHWNVLMHEWVGYLSYWIMGYF